MCLSVLMADAAVTWRSLLFAGVTLRDFSAVSSVWKSVPLKRPSR